MSTRVNPFANVAEPPVFTTKPKTEKPVPTETMERIATENNFPSRQAPKPPATPRRKPRRYKTGAISSSTSRRRATRLRDFSRRLTRKMFLSAKC
jgi:hypothetical protein